MKVMICVMFCSVSTIGFCEVLKDFPSCLRTYARRPVAVSMLAVISGERERVKDAVFM